MFGPQVTPKRGNRDEAEKPFWISFADLMTALMILFLVVMAVALVAVTTAARKAQSDIEKHQGLISECVNKFDTAASEYGITLDKSHFIVKFAERARFAFNSYTLSPEQEAAIRGFTPKMLNLTADVTCSSVLKRFVVEGYTDKTGSYLSNLNLSLQRSQRVLCALFSTKGNNLLTDKEKKQVRDRFLVGGYSFNTAQESDEDSRRVELRIEFLSLGEKPPNSGEIDRPGDIGECALR